jgi:hypothetical protein
MNSFFENKKKFVLSMWKLTLGYGTTTIAHDPHLHNCHIGTSPNMSWDEEHAMLTLSCHDMSMLPTPNVTCTWVQILLLPK